MTDLSTSLFSVPRDKRLLFFHQDLEMISRSNAASVAAVNQNMNTLARKLRQKGIALYFLPAPNKYTVYYDHFVDRTLPPSLFFELLRTLPKEYTFIDTKKLLVEEVNKGEKDVYYSDDTHWSWKAAKKIAENIRL
jgi:lysophospholipase L1-like esterase